MDKYDLTQEQWDEMVTGRLKSAEKALKDGTAMLIPYKQARTEIMEHIQQIAEKERAKAALSYQSNYSYESESTTV